MPMAPRCPLASASSSSVAAGAVRGDHLPRPDRPDADRADAGGESSRPDGRQRRARCHGRAGHHRLGGRQPAACPPASAAPARACMTRIVGCSVMIAAAARRSSSPSWPRSPSTGARPMVLGRAPRHSSTTLADRLPTPICNEQHAGAARRHHLPWPRNWNRRQARCYDEEIRLRFALFLKKVLTSRPSPCRRSPRANPRRQPHHQAQINVPGARAVPDAAEGHARAGREERASRC